MVGKLLKSIKVKVKKIYKTYAIFELEHQEELKQAADILSQRDEILACEWLQKRIIYGINAQLPEMAKFKTKIRKQEEIDQKSDL